MFVFTIFLKDNAALQTAATCSRWFAAREFFHPENGSDIFLRNVGSCKIYTATHPRRQLQILQRKLCFAIEWYSCFEVEVYSFKSQKGHITSRATNIKKYFGSWRAQ
jgi:hypothetical protein